MPAPGIELRPPAWVGPAVSFSLLKCRYNIKLDLGSVLSSPLRCGYNPKVDRESVTVSPQTATGDAKITPN